MMAKRSPVVRRSAALLLVVAAILALGYLIKLAPGDWTLTTEEKRLPSVVLAPPLTADREPEPLPEIDRQHWRVPSAAISSPGDHSRQQLEAQTRILFEHGLALLQSGDFTAAITALEMVITLAPAMPEAFVNLGFALYEVGEFDAARGAFLRAIDLNPAQANGYYGAAIAYEAVGELEAALGAMRSYLHIADGQQRFKARGRAAIWEWEQALGRRPAVSAPLLSAPQSAIESSALEQSGVTAGGN